MNYNHLLPYVAYWRNLHFHCLTENEVSGKWMQMRIANELANELIFKVELSLTFPPEVFFSFSYSAGEWSAYIYMSINHFANVCKKNVFNTLYLLGQEDTLLPSPTNYYCFDMSQWSFNEEKHVGCEKCRIWIKYHSQHWRFQW